MEINHRNSDMIKMIESNNEQFERKRNKGENVNHICTLIQNDDINGFIEFANRTNLSLTSKMKPSVFETNLFILKRSTTLIEYSAFYGSIQIFKYLIMNKVALTQSLWLYAIHGKNPEIIHILENVLSDIPTEMLDEVYKESIKCHHIDIMNYIKNKYIQYTIEKKSQYINYCLQFYNFIEFSEIINNVNDFNDVCQFDTSIEGNHKFNAFYGMCKYDYFTLFEYLLNNLNINVNMKVIILISF